jgi:3-hydroxyacyl-[acyl-carrier-protein] dehydratase
MNRIKIEILKAKSGELEVSGTDTAIRRYLFDDGFIGFDGHFPGHPVIPAFVQILSALTVIEEWNGSPFKLLAVPKAKFHRELKPGQEVSVTCKQHTGQKEIPVDVKLTTTEGLAADFRMIIERV